MDIREDLEHLGALLGQVRDAGQAFVEGLDRRPAAIRPQPMEPLELPDQGLGGQKALASFRQRFEGGMSGSPGPRYLGFVTGGTTPAALAGDWLASAYDQNLSNDGDSIGTTVELETLSMLRSLFGLPDSFAGAFVSGATQANMVALATARQWAAERLDVNVAEDGLWGLRPIPVLAGSAHASILKALSMLGMGGSCLVRLPCLPGRQAVDLAALEEKLAALNGAPAIVNASAGDVNTGDFDDLETLAELCAHHGAWLHVDGAFGLFAACDPDRADLLRGLAAADSVATDGHKWLNVPYDSGIVFTRHLDHQEEVFKAVAAYLGSGPDMLHRTPENSRRFRALPAWMTLIAYGRSGYRALVRRCCALASRLGEGIEASRDYELLAPVRLNVVCFALTAGDVGRRDHVLAKLVDDGRVFLTPTVYNGRVGFRAAFVNWLTIEQDINIVLEALADAAG